MKGYKLFMDVSGDVMPDIAKGEVQLLPMEFEIGNDEYVYTGGNDGMDPVEFYKFVKQGVPMKTSQITPSLFENYFEETLKEGYSALYLCLSSGLSATYESACHAAECLKRKYPEVDLVPVDSLTATVGMGLLCERMIKTKRGVVRLAEQGRFAVCTEQADHYGGSRRPQHAEKGRKDQLRRGCYRRTAQFQAHSACAGGRHS